MPGSIDHALYVLGLDAQVSLADVLLTRRILAKKYHPDRCVDQDRATRHMARINVAVDTLVAHFKTHATLKTKHPKSASKTANTAHRAWTGSRRRTTDQKPTADNRREANTNRDQRSAAKAANTAQPKATQPKTRPSQEAPNPNLSRIRMASAAYRAALGRIGIVATAPRVDITALAEAKRV